MKKRLLSSLSLITLLSLTGCGATQNSDVPAESNSVGDVSLSESTAEELSVSESETAVVPLTDWTEADKKVMNDVLGQEIPFLNLTKYFVEESNGYLFAYGQLDIDTIKGWKKSFLQDGYKFASFGDGINRLNGKDYLVSKNDLRMELSYYNFGDDTYYVSAYCYINEQTSGIKNYKYMYYTPGYTSGMEPCEVYSLRFYNEDGTVEYADKRLVVKYGYELGDIALDDSSFSGWYVNGDYLFDATAPVVANYKLYASFNKPESTLNYIQPTSYSLNYYDLKASSNKTAYCSPLGDQKVLVIPVAFDGFQSMDRETGRELIQKGFFGESDETGWESVASFYKKSSYGKLNISGEVSDWFYVGKTYEEMNNLDGYTYESDFVLRQAVKWYKQNNPGKAAEFDRDGDGYFDCVWMVYDYPYDHSVTTKNGRTLWWAYVSRDMSNAEQPSVDSPIGYTYAWASLKFFTDANYRNSENKLVADSHTFIHEHGHIMGNEDYYDYKNGTAWAGKTIMQDHNVGDHDMFSKMSFGWTTPKVVTGSGDIEIGLAVDTGDCIIFKNNTWNQSLLDEYILIEFYSPTGVNQKDAEKRYKGSYPQLCTEYGLKVWHVDARPALSFAGTETFIRYTNSDQFLDRYCVSLAHSNTPDYSINPNRMLLQLLESSGVSTFGKNDNINPTNALLFQEGDSFEVSKFATDYFKNNGKFNDGSEVGYTFTVKSMNNEKAVISFTKVA